MTRIKSRKLQFIAEMKLSPEENAFMVKYGKTATKAVTRYLRRCDCKSNDQRLGALSALCNVMLAMGDGISAAELDKVALGPKN